jgi:CHAT domain-containing protein
MRPVVAPAPARRLCVVVLLLVAAWAVWAEEPAQTPRLTAEQQKKLRQAEHHKGQAIRFFLKNKTAEGIAEWQKKLDLERTVWGKDHPNLVPSLQALARLLVTVDDSAEARKALQEVLAIQIKQLGEKHWQVGDARRALADLDLRARLKPADRALLRQALFLNAQVSQLHRAGRSRQALPLAERALAIRGKILGKDHPDYAESLFNLAAQYKALAEYARAGPLYQRSLAIFEVRLGKDHPAVATCLNNLALLYWAQGEYGKAEPLLQRSLTLNEARLGKDHPDVALGLSNLGGLYKEQGQYGKAEPLLKRSLQIREARLGKDHLDVAQSLNNLAQLYQAQYHNARAEPLLKRSLRIYEARLGKDHPSVATCLTNLAGLYKDQGQYARAEPLYQRGLAVREARLGKDHPDVANSLNNLALLYRIQGQYWRAEPLYQRSLAILEARHGKDHADVATCLNNLALLYQGQGQYGKAEPLLQRRLAIAEARLGKDHPDVATGLNNLAALYSTQGRYGKAKPLYQRSLAIAEARLGKDHPDVARSLNNLAALYRTQGHHASAEPLLKRSLRIYEARLGKDHPDVANCLGNLALLYEAQGQYDRAEPLLQRSLQIREVRFGKDHPLVASSLHNLAGLYVSQGRWGQAVQAFDQARRGLRQHLHQVLPALSPQEQLTFLYTQVESPLHAALSLALRRRGDPGVAEQSAAWLLNSKALTQQALAQPLALARAGAHAHLTALHGQLLDVRQQLARLTLASAKPGQEERRRQQLDALIRQERQLTRELGQKSGEQLTHPGWVELAAIRKSLPPDAVLIDIARFDVWDFQARGRERRWQAARYAAWVIPPKGQGPVRLIDLGEAAPLDAAVQAVRRRLATAPQALAGQSEAAVEQQLRRTLNVLARRLLGPLAEHIGKTRHWIISSDGALWLVPWSALPLADGSYAIEKHRLNYVVSGRDLVRPSDQVQAQGALVLADPDFELLPAPATNRATTAGVSRGLLPGTTLPRFQRLRGTAREARAIAPLVAQFTGQQPALRVGREAREETFKALRGPRVVVLSTHGYFLEDQDQALAPALAGLESRGLKLTALERPRPKGEKVQVLENPLLRCGLALAGANQRDQVGPDQEDGILTGLEIVGTDLRGTELVVLSACETGLGKVNVGEGVAGLRQAFQLAGARAVVATLWQIPDRETTALMTAFFTHLAAHKGKAEALRQAQLDVIKQRRAKGKAAHPFYWAAFTLTGQWR